MSRWAVTLAFDGEYQGDEVEWRKPFRYAENREPDEDGRGGHLMLAETCADGGNWDVIAPFVRLSIEGRGYGSVHKERDEAVQADVVLDAKHVDELIVALVRWKGETAMSEETKIEGYTARRLAAAVSRIIELDTIELTRNTLSEEDFYERTELRDLVEEAEDSEDSFVQGVLAPLQSWDEAGE